MAKNQTGFSFFKHLCLYLLLINAFLSFSVAVTYLGVFSPSSNIFNKSHTSFYLNKSPFVDDPSGNTLRTTWSDFIVKNPSNISLLTPSIFPNLLPPTIHFSAQSLSGLKQAAPGVYQLISKLKWIWTIRLVNKVAKNMGFRLISIPRFSRKTSSIAKVKSVKSDAEGDDDDWFGYFTTTVGTRNSIPKYVLQTPYQKFNLISGGESLCDKDKMWSNLRRSQAKLGGNSVLSKSLFDSYAWPTEAYQFMHRLHYTKFKANSQSRFTSNEWIYKPREGSIGNGIVVFSHWEQLESSWEFKRHKFGVIQAYFSKSNSYLIHGRMIRLRAFVLITSVNPLRIYMYKIMEPLLVEETRVGTLNIPYDQFIALVAQQKQRAFNVTKLNLQVQDTIVLALLSVEAKLSAAALKHSFNRYNTYQLYSADFTIDKVGTPLLMEFNRYADLSTNSVSEAELRIPLLLETLNLVGYHLPPTKIFRSKKARKVLLNHINSSRAGSQPLEFNNSFFEFPNMQNIMQNKIGFNFEEWYATYRSNNSTKHREMYLSSILKNLSQDELYELMISENELSRARNYERIFPSKYTYRYLRYLMTSSNPYMYLLQDAWETNYGGHNRTLGVQYLRNQIKNNYGKA